MAIDRSFAAQSVNELLMDPLNVYLDGDSVTEICIQRENELWIEDGRWTRHTVGFLDRKSLVRICTAVANYNGGHVSEDHPILSCVLPDGCRIQLVMPPVVPPRTISLTIRKPSIRTMAIDEYSPEYFDKVPASVLTDAVESGDTIVVCGETSSGKTTLLKTLIPYMPPWSRVITIEDVPEITLPSHPHHVPMFYNARKEPDGTWRGVTATDCLISCLRQRPDRIVLGECRGGEASTFINICASGHGGSLTSCHAGSCDLAIYRLAIMCSMTVEGRALPFDETKRLIESVVDIVVHVTKATATTPRHITEIKRLNG